MPWLAAVVPAVASIAGALITSNSQNKASEDATAAQNQALDFQKEQWQTQQENQAPYLAAGKEALPQYTKMATNPSQFQFNTTGPNADPSYQWRINQGLAGVNASAAAGGGYFSGATGQALTNYGQGAASQEYQNQFNRYLTTEQNQFNELGLISVVESV